MFSHFLFVLKEGTCCQKVRQQAAPPLFPIFPECPRRGWDQRGRPVVLVDVVPLFLQLSVEAFVLENEVPQDGGRPDDLTSFL